MLASAVVCLAVSTSVRHWSLLNTSVAVDQLKLAQLLCHSVFLAETCPFINCSKMNHHNIAPSRINFMSTHLSVYGQVTCESISLDQVQMNVTTGAIETKSS